MIKKGIQYLSEITLTSFIAFSVIFCIGILWDKEAYNEGVPLAIDWGWRAIVLACVFWLVLLPFTHKFSGVYAWTIQLSARVFLAVVIAIFIPISRIAPPPKMLVLMKSEPAKVVTEGLEKIDTFTKADTIEFPDEL